MVYLSRILIKLGEVEQFQFHPRCKELKLTHMCFANDLIMCCKGDYVSIHLMLRAFKRFSNTSGLKANISKSAFYTCGMQQEDVERVTMASGFTQQSLPFRYLQVPICANKVSDGKCEALIDKMIARIRIWSSRNLSYSARVQLINSVLLSLHVYWA